jgi:Flp pilus assembly protein TadB
MAMSDEFTARDGIWMRLLWMIVVGALFMVARSVLFIGAALQFIFILVTRERNQRIADFGDSLADWLDKAARYLVAATEDKPFPWTAWGRKPAE